MGRSGYSDYCGDSWELNCWDGAVASAIRGKRGQEFLRELSSVLDMLPEKKLIANKLEEDGAVCAIGAVCRARRIDMSRIDPYGREMIASMFNIAPALVAEIAFMNDEWIQKESSESRYERMRQWVKALVQS